MFPYSLGADDEPDSQVLKDLPKKTERIEWCEMTALQKAIYRDALQRSRKAVLDATTTPPSDTTTNGKVKQRPRNTKKSKDASANVLMDLRKAASHPMLFRRLFDDAAIKVMARQCMKEPEFSGSNYNFIVEDMEVMTDAELQAFSLKYKVGRFLQYYLCLTFIFSLQGNLRKNLIVSKMLERYQCFSRYWIGTQRRGAEF